MSINIGNNNKIKDSIIAENTSITEDKLEQNSAHKHPIITGIFIAVVAGFILTFSFWDKIKTFVEELIQ